MRKFALLLTIGVLTSCSGSDAPPRFVAVNTLCTTVERYYATPAQAAAFKADQGMWESLVNWVLGVNKERDRQCLAPKEGP